MPFPRPVILILGPTASGKTDLAIELAQRLEGGGECISADSMQIYRGMDIGTGKPCLQDRRGIRHHLMDVADPSDDTFSVDRWLGLAHQSIADIRQRGKWPIVVGGTNLYVQSLVFGMLEGPEPDPELRRQIQDLPADERRAWLERVDPHAAARIHPNDLKRTTRAIEVFEKTGQQISAMQDHWNVEPIATALGPLLVIGLEFAVDTINHRINSRVMAMIKAGLVEEVQGLLGENRFGRNAREALGYKQIIEYLEGQCSLEDAVEQIKIRTRRYAKQQRTWLKRFRAWPNTAWIRADNLTPTEVLDTALNAIANASQPSAGAAPCRNGGN